MEAHDGPELGGGSDREMEIAGPGRGDRRQPNQRRCLVDQRIPAVEAHNLRPIGIRGKLPKSRQQIVTHRQSLDESHQDCCLVSHSYSPKSNDRSGDDLRADDTHRCKSNGRSGCDCRADDTHGRKSHGRSSSDLRADGTHGQGSYRCSGGDLRADGIHRQKSYRCSSGDLRTDGTHRQKSYGCSGASSDSDQCSNKSTDSCSHPTSDRSSHRVSDRASLESSDETPNPAADPDRTAGTKSIAAHAHSCRAGAHSPSGTESDSGGCGTGSGSGPNAATASPHHDWKPPEALDSASAWSGSCSRGFRVFHIRGTKHSECQQVW
mmetsp:Transcript_184/g.382  ORF Transcript_184/g.382 Transcript_184/m.382 type:complete len:322 (-) Transcript_184:2067-3032(-)